MSGAVKNKIMTWTAFFRSFLLHGLKLDDVEMCGRQKMGKEPFYINILFYEQRKVNGLESNLSAFNHLTYWDF